MLRRQPAYQEHAGCIAEYDPENRLTYMSGGVNSSYVHDGDGNRVREDDDGVVRVFVGNLYKRQYYLENCSDGVAQKWTAATGAWAVTGGGYRQSATTSNTNAYRAWAQGSAFNYEWQATYTSGTSAGFYLFASASTSAERGNSYRIWQDATTVKLYESANDVATQRASWAAANAAGQSHTYQVSYDPLTGSFSVKLYRGKILPIRVLDTPAPPPLYCSRHRVTGPDGA